MNEKKTVLMTGATGNMGFESLKMMVEDLNNYNIRLIVRDSEKNHDLLKPYLHKEGLSIVWGDLDDYEVVKRAVSGVDLILHIAAFVSPYADYYPKKAMIVNYGSTYNLIKAIMELNQNDKTYFVYIGTVAETGDRMPPIHWGRVGDPIKPSMFDYYAVSKVASERLVIESGLKRFASLRQTGIIGKGMAKINDAIMFHNCLNNVLEYVSDRDSGRAMRNLTYLFFNNQLDASFWNHIYNIGGGASCRISTYDLYKNMYGKFGLTHLEYVLDPSMIATRNFHGHYYLDSDKLENYLHFRHDGFDYYYDSFIETLGGTFNFMKFMCKTNLGQKMIGSIMKNKFNKLAMTEHGTLHFLKDNLEPQIEAYWGGKEKQAAISHDFRDFKPYQDYDKVIVLDHGYDESKPESELDIDDMKKAAAFRGGELLSTDMVKGDWSTKLVFKDAFGHTFKASPRLVLEGGFWCDDCEKRSWNYAERAKVDPFFAQVWTPLHDDTEKREYPKVASEDDFLKGIK